MSVPEWVTKILFPILGVVGTGGAGAGLWVTIQNRKDALRNRKIDELEKDCKSWTEAIEGLVKSLKDYRQPTDFIEGCLREAQGEFAKCSVGRKPSSKERQEDYAFYAVTLEELWQHVNKQYEAVLAERIARNGDYGQLTNEEIVREG